MTEYIEAIQRLAEQFGRLSGVGRKTANVVLNVWFSKPTLAVDTHVMRVSKRLNFSTSTTPLGVEKDLLRVLPKEYIKKTNHWLVLFGRYVCKAQNPKCDECFINRYCHSKDKKSKNY